MRSNQEQMQAHPGVPYIYFDLTNWDIKSLSTTTIHGNPVTIGLIPEEDIRVALKASGPL